MTSKLEKFAIIIGGTLISLFGIAFIVIIAIKDIQIG